MMVTFVFGGPDVFDRKREHGNGGYFSGCGHSCVPCRLNEELRSGLTAPAPGLGFGSFDGALADAVPAKESDIAAATNKTRNDEARRLLIRILQWALETLR